jgi:hypothetical protein
MELGSYFLFLQEQTTAFNIEVDHHLHNLGCRDSDFALQLGPVRNPVL